MNSIDSKLSKILKSAEKAVLEILSESAVARDYGAIDRSREIAEKIRGLNKGLIKGIGADEQVAGGNRRQPPKAKRTRKARTAKKREYPKFELNDGSLTKLGWSKKKNDTYVHRVPSSTVNLVFQALKEFGGDPDPVSSERIINFELLKEKVPNYQVYIVLAFLKDRKVIASVGRDGFKIPFEISMRIEAALSEENRS
jgi:hypothetical protein